MIHKSLKPLWISAIAIGLAFSSYSVSALPFNTKFTQNASGDERKVKNFEGVASGGPLQVVITLGNTESLRFEGDQEAISTLVSEIKGSTLIIRPQISWTSWARKYQGKKIVAYITAKKIRNLVMSGDGSITVNGTINEDALNATLSGSGNMNVKVNVNKLNAVVSGSGTLNVTGKADDASVTLSGSGSLPKSGFEVGDLSAVISGSGNVNVTTNGNIDALISGSGSVNYKGNASVTQKTFGSGKVKRI
ncbi:head GIN domain-containing protein [Pedobacter montanisoli]|uniref:DUF2807 domain-containing protein n=1 Tax=Pedobacter montanisoli TaxID=2923277 RepID=A0ABS9ZUY9_9SPHI|nr:head GIN domain-containing protein [Pedobacter montanisoli]MCJ0742198.1 DUF2807 domain-containing protein [Pedobacter montanisoli]